MSLCLPAADDSPKDKNKFCAADPDGEGTATGRQVVEEDLRQICIFKNSEKWSNPEVQPYSILPLRPKMMKLCLCVQR